MLQKTKRRPYDVEGYTNYNTSLTQGLDNKDE